MSSTMTEEPSAGFDFSNHLRNQHILSASKSKGASSSSLPKATSTGTTIVGCIFGEGKGIALGADTRATEGDIVADKNCEKIHYLTDNIYCCGAGTAADTEFTTQMISSNLKLHELNTGRQPRVVTAMTMLKQWLFRHQGQIGAALVLGGVDPTGANLFTVAPHGSTDKLPYVTMGSGSLAAMSMFESRWTRTLDRQAAIDLVADAIKAGIFNDLGSGSNVDVVVIESTGTEVLRNYERPNIRVPKEKSYRFNKGDTEIKKLEVKKLVESEEVLVFDGKPGGTASGRLDSGAGTAGEARMDVDV